MNHKIIVLIKWIFLFIGIGLLALAFLFKSEAAILLVLTGLLFAFIGGGIIDYGWWSAKKELYLKQHGHLIQADFQQVELNEALEVNGTNPFRIVAQWHEEQKNQLFVFRSANLWFDPTEFVKGRSIPVYVDLKKPTRYHMDASFLPELQG